MLSHFNYYQQTIEYRQHFSKFMVLQLENC